MQKVTGLANRPAFEIMGYQRLNTLVVEAVVASHGIVPLDDDRSHRGT